MAPRGAYHCVIPRSARNDIVHSILATRESMRVLAPALLLLAACAQTPAPDPSASAGAVRPGIEVLLADIPQRLRGKRVALLTNNSGIDRQKRLDIDLIAQHKDLKLVALLAAEHGIRGDAMNGVRIARSSRSVPRG